jgi:hypothetical protein
VVAIEAVAVLGWTPPSLAVPASTAAVAPASSEGRGEPVLALQAFATSAELSQVSVERVFKQIPDQLEGGAHSYLVALVSTAKSRVEILPCFRTSAHAAAC